MNTHYVCPVCGFTLQYQPWNETNGASDEICPSCGIHFGYDDHAAGDPSKRPEFYKQWREKWVQNGMKWWSTNPKPSNWNPQEQLKKVIK